MSSITHHHHHHHHHHLVPYIVSFLFASSPSLSDLKRAHAVLVVSGAALRKPTARRLVALYCLRSPASAAAPLVASHLRSPDPSPPIWPSNPSCADPAPATPSPSSAAPPTPPAAAPAAARFRSSSPPPSSAIRSITASSSTASH
uniref:Uncharacterized protein n=1 Tax=Ananas comosus var. bracteatus TaxID=296719 RepID=A0A6V7PX67_ANACO|nr:unnamed protein product [Ananas comosus var. bracteatus]